MRNNILAQIIYEIDGVSQNDLKNLFIIWEALLMNLLFISQLYLNWKFKFSCIFDLGI